MLLLKLSGIRGMQMWSPRMRFHSEKNRQKMPLHLIVFSWFSIRAVTIPALDPESDFNTFWDFWWFQLRIRIQALMIQISNGSGSSNGFRSTSVSCSANRLILAHFAWNHTAWLNIRHVHLQKRADSNGGSDSTMDPDPGNSNSGSSGSGSTKKWIRNTSILNLLSLSDFRRLRPSRMWWLSRRSSPTCGRTWRSLCWTARLRASTRGCSRGRYRRRSSRQRTTLTSPTRASEYQTSSL